MKMYDPFKWTRLQVIMNIFLIMITIPKIVINVLDIAEKNTSIYYKLSLLFSVLTVIILSIHTFKIIRRIKYYETSLTQTEKFLPWIMGATVIAAVTLPYFN